VRRADDDLTPFDAAVAGVLARLRPGDVMTYGEVAAEAGHPGAARAVGSFLARSGGEHPWWRVVTSTGRLVPGHEVEHRRLLRAEGVEVDDATGRVRPGVRPARATQGSRSARRSR
jgi:methylated-DNA-protein-cysteine methyltransferase-like protein